MSSSKHADGLRVAVVSANHETLDDLRGYLRGVGVEAACGRKLDVLEGLPATVVALVVFPDDFLRQNVVTRLAAIIDLRPRLLAILVTGDARRYSDDLPRSPRIVVVPRPVWAWAIYDAIRPHLATRTGDEKRAARQRPVPR
jgi:hypothetical protein